MRYDFSPLFRSSVGFDHLSRALDNAINGQGEFTGYPPYNILRSGENRYEIVMAVAGFSESDLEVTQEDNTLTVNGRREDEAGESVHYLHKGIAARPFTRSFTLAEHVRVSGARFENGMLRIDLVRDIPEAKRPRTIPIGTRQLEAA